MATLEENLEILIITYNRAPFLERTLEQLGQSPFGNCKITVLDNCSTDATPEVCARQHASLPDFHVVRHAKNIGACANYLRAVEMSRALYTWALCDDDTFDWSDCGDVIEAVKKGNFDLISLGAAGGFEWKRDVVTSGAQLLKKDAAFFYVSSFIPSLIFKTALFDSQCLARGYYISANLFPHFEFLKKAVREDFSIYIARGQLIQRGDAQNLLSGLHWFSMYVNNCSTIEDVRVRRRVIRQATTGSFLGKLAAWIALEKMQAPRRVGRELAELWMAFSADQRVALSLAAPLALVPAPVYKSLNALRHRIKGKAETVEADVDPFRF